MYSILLCFYISISAQEILIKIDALRNPGEDYELMVHLTTADEHYQLKVYVKGQDKTLIKFLTPTKWQGRLILLNGANMWFYTPQARPVRIAPIHRLIGGFSNADIASTYFSADYDGTIVSQEGDYVLELTPKSKRAAYGKIRLWVNKSDFRLKKGEFYSPSGRLLKEIYYTDYKRIDDGEYYTKLVVIDKVHRDEKTEMEFSDFKKVNLSPRIFNKEYLPYFK
ncbi:MAG: outer membrane lipoprotein-sorting protein [bacterium]